MSVAVLTEALVSIPDSPACPGLTYMCCVVFVSDRTNHYWIDFKSKSQITS